MLLFALILLSLCTALAQSSPEPCLHCMAGSPKFPSIHQGSAVCHWCLKHWFSELGCSLLHKKEWQGVKQQKLQLSPSFFFSQLDNFCYLQKTPGLEGSCQHCSGTAHLDWFLKFCLSAGEKRHIQSDPTLLRNPVNYPHGWMEPVHRACPPKQHQESPQNPKNQNTHPKSKPSNLFWMVVQIIHGHREQMGSQLQLSMGILTQGWVFWAPSTWLSKGSSTAGAVPSSSDAAPKKGEQHSPGIHSLHQQPPEQTVLRMDHRDALTPTVRKNLFW